MSDALSIGRAQSRGDATFRPGLRPPRSSEHLLELRDGAAGDQHVVEAHEADGVSVTR
jgi:hypothetical protein